jgi:oligoribonuclease NrnB/cAMP/cGMP phosphodiesterase (DHH superfamily)
MNQPGRVHLIIYHGKCDDGFGAAWSAKRWLQNYDYSSRIVLYAATYGKPVPYDLIDSNTVVHILDFSYPSEILNVIHEKAAAIILLDHHKSAFERFCADPPTFLQNTRDLKVFPIRVDTVLELRSPKVLVRFNMAKSGAMLAWEHYSNPTKDRYNTPAPKLITHIQDNDLWKFEHAHTKEFIEALRSFPQEIEVWEHINAMLSTELDGYSRFIEQGSTIVRYYNQKLAEIIETTRENCTILGYVGLCCNAPKMFASDIGNILAKTTHTFGATWFKRADGKVEWSLRSIGHDLDVSQLAVQFGGGGHENSAGFTLSPTTEEDTVDGIKLWHTRDGDQ